MYVDWGFLQEITDADALFQKELIEEFCEQAGRLSERIEDAAAAKDALELHRAAHSLKGSAASVGAATLAEAAAELDERAKAGDMGGALEVLARLEQALGGTLAEMQEWIRKAA